MCNAAVRRLTAVFALLTCVALNAQERADVVIYIPPVTGTGSTAADNVFFQELTAMEVGARGYTLREGDVPYDYTFEGSLGRTYLGAEEWFFHLDIVEAATGKTIVAQELAFKRREDVYEFFPVLIFTMLANVPLTKDLGTPIAPVVEAPKVPSQYWLYAGLRAGSSMRIYTRATAAPFLESETNHWENVNFAIYASYNFWFFLDIQAEVMISNEFAPFQSFIFDHNQGMATLRGAPFTGWSMMVPVMLKASFRREPVFASVLGGVYLNIPLGDMQNEAMGGSFPYVFEFPLGYTVGVSVGTKAGPGRIMLDFRWAQDLSPAIKASSGEPLFTRSMMIFAISYEFPFFRKKTPEEKAAEKAKQAEAPPPSGGQPAANAAGQIRN